MALSEDTDRSQAVILKHLSPSWVKQIDDIAGEAKSKNGGYFNLNDVRFEGQARPKHFDVNIRYLSYKPV